MRRRRSGGRGKAQWIESEVLTRLGRASRGMPYAQLARAMGMNAETVRRQVCGLSRLSAEFVARASLVLELPADQLLFGRRGKR